VHSGDIFFDNISRMTFQNSGFALEPTLSRCKKFLSSHFYPTRSTPASSPSQYKPSFRLLFAGQPYLTRATLNHVYSQEKYVQLFMKGSSFVLS